MVQRLAGGAFEGRSAVSCWLLSGRRPTTRNRSVHSDRIYRFLPMLWTSARQRAVEVLHCAVMSVRSDTSVLGPVVAVAVLGGCSSGNAGPQRLAPVTRPPAAGRSPSTTPSPSATPTGSRGPTAANAAAFVRAYYAAINKAAVTGRPARLQPFVTNSCSICRDYQGSIIRSARAGHHLVKPPLVLRHTRGYPKRMLSTVTVLIGAPSVAILDQDNRRVGVVPFRRSYAESVALAWDGRSWRITDITEFPS